MPRGSAGCDLRLGSGDIRIEVGQGKPLAVKNKFLPLPKAPGLDGKGPVKTVVPGVLVGVLAKEDPVVKLAS